MSVTDANPAHPTFIDDYVLQEVDVEWMSKAVKPKQFIHIDQSECIMCEGCVDICPWKCIHMVRPDAISEAVGTEQPGTDPSDHVIFTIDGVGTDNRTRRTNRSRETRRWPTTTARSRRARRSRSG